MTMRGKGRILVGLLLMAGVVFAVANVSLGEPQEAAAAIAVEQVKKQDVKVLYAGNPEHERTADFEKFLKQHFTEVGVTSFEKVTPESAKDYDVIIFDWSKILMKDANGALSLKMPKRPDLPKDFRPPMILIGGSGVQVAEKLGAKIHWL